MHRILHIVPQFQPGDGISSVVMNYAKSVDHTRFVFDVITHRVDHPAYVDAIRNLGGTVHVLPGFSPKALPQLNRWIRDFFAQNRKDYDTVHCHMSNAAFLYLREAKRAGIPVRILHSHQTKYADTFSHAVRNVPLIAWGKRYANVNIACSQQAGAFLFGKHPFILLPNAVDTQRFAFNAATRDEFRANMHLTDGNRLYGNVGRLAIQKNQGFLLNAFRLVHERDDSARLLIIGEGPLKAELHAKAQELGIVDAVIWVDNTSRPDGYYNAMDVFLLPSLHEGLPVSLVEAQCSGLPCLIAEDIDKQSLILPDVQQLPIDHAMVWAQRMLETKDTPRDERAQGQSAVSEAGFDMLRQAKTLETIYLSHAASAR
ncbi:glycosyltransferase [Bifidobacterium primatium]|uniref:Glycosyltransferase n=1 Tax=Bifidobacterium primatium TaxID=2045438 RepID=A0A2M9HBA6_9BIFI|nr:glycosyltransferase [Bifidobacterium primatium]PJM74090.1 glycosyltransferase [Bifidobacterium primatium]